MTTSLNKEDIDRLREVFADVARLEGVEDFEFMATSPFTNFTDKIMIKAAEQLPLAIMNIGLAFAYGGLTKLAWNRLVPRVAPNMRRIGLVQAAVFSTAFLNTVAPTPVAREDDDPETVRRKNMATRALSLVALAASTTWVLRSRAK